MEQELPPPSSTDAGVSLSGSTIKKRPRGKIIGKRVINLLVGVKFTVSFDYAHRAIGEYKPDYVTHQEVVVRNMHITPLAYTSWHKVPSEIKQKMVDDVLEKFIIGDEKERLDLLLKSLGKKWKDYRAELKYKYYNNKDDEVRIQNRPPGVSESDWTWLLNYWGREGIQETCRRNKESRSVQQMHHRSGRASFAVVANKEKESCGIRPDRLRMFELTYTDNKGQYKDDNMATRKEAEIYELITTREQGLNSLSDEDLFTQVFGKERSGRVRCLGLGLTPTLFFGTQSSRNINLARQLEESIKHEKYLETSLDQLKAKIDDDKQKRAEEDSIRQAETQAQIERMMEEQGTQSQAQIERVMDEMMRMMGIFQQQSQPSYADTI